MVTSSQAKRIIFPHLFLYLELRRSERKRSNYPTQTPSVAAEMHVGSSYQLTRGLVTYDTEARDNRHEGSFLPLRVDDGLLQGDKSNGGEGKRNLPFCSDRQGQKGGMDNGEGVNACTDGRGTGRRRRACLYAPGNRT